MLRMAHRILSHKGPISSCGVNGYLRGFSQEDINVISESATTLHQAVSPLVNKSQVIICDNVAEYVSENSAESFHPSRHSLSVTPPFPLTLLEWSDRSGGSQVAMLIETTDTNDKDSRERLSGVSFMAIEQFKEDLTLQSRWVCSCVLYFSISGTLAVLPARIHVFLSESGIVSERLLVVSNVGLSETCGSAFGFAGGVGFLALAFMNCKNVELHYSPKSSPEDKWLRRMKQPRIQYKVLNINPFKKFAESTGSGGMVWVVKSLHICKGHFEDHTKGKGLFGKHKVVVWKPAHIRGNANSGIVVKDYKIGGVP